MSRYIGRPDSVFGGNPGFLAEGILNAFITGNVNANELCTIFESACIRRTDPSLPWSVINSDDPDPVLVFDPALIINLSLTGKTVFNCCGTPFRLSNLWYIIPVQSPSGIGFIVRSSVAQEVCNFILVSTDTCTVPPQCVPLANGSFAIIWVTSSTIKFCVVTPGTSGFTLGTVTTVTSICSTSGFVPYFGFCVLANGNFIITWATTGGVLQGAIYTPAGAIVGSVFTIDASCSGEHHAAQPCNNGDVVIYCHDAAHTVYKVYRCTNTGSVTWGPITPAGCGTALFTTPDAARVHPAENRICEMLAHNSLPHICVSLPNTSQYCNQFILTGETGALVQQCDIGTQFHDQNCHNAITPTPAGFAVSHTVAAQTATYVSYFDYNGNPIHLNVKCDDGGHAFAASDSPVVHTYCGFSNAAVCITRYAASNTGLVELRCIHINVAGLILADPINYQPYGPGDCNSPHPRCDSDGTAFLCHFSSGAQQLLCCHFKAGRSSVIGVAQAAATNGQAVVIQAEGYFNLPNTQIFGPGVAFDRRNSTPLGPRGVVGGQTAILFGWV